MSLSLEMGDLFAKQMLNVNGQSVNLDAIDIKEIQELLGDSSLLQPYVQAPEQGMYAVERNLMFQFKMNFKLTGFKILLKSNLVSRESDLYGIWVLIVCKACSFNIVVYIEGKQGKNLLLPSFSFKL